MTNVVNNMTKQILDNILIELKREENMNKIRDSILEPIISYSIQKTYPFIFITGALFILTFLIAIVTLIILLRK
jgi:hypothetical protein